MFALDNESPRRYSDSEWDSEEEYQRGLRHIRDDPRPTGMGYPGNHLSECYREKSIKDDPENMSFTESEKNSVDEAVDEIRPLVANIIQKLEDSN